MFSCGNQADTSLPDIAADLDQQFSVNISKEGIHKRFNSQAVIFLKELIKSQLAKQLVRPVDPGLKKEFAGINIKDSSKFFLPSTYNGAYPGFGNFSKTSGLMNIQYEYEILSGDWRTIDLTTIEKNDQRDSKENIESIRKGELYIRDLGYITPTYLKAIIAKGATFLNRLPPQAAVFTLKKEPLNWRDIDRQLKKTRASALDKNVLIYNSHLIACRLIVERVSDDVYRKRLRQAQQIAKSHGVGLTQKHKIRCRYNTFITNTNKKQLPVKEIRKCYYLRWQIELVFRTWKSFFEIDKLKKVKKERFECQLLAKLLWVLLNWRLFQACNHHVQQYTPSAGVSIIKFFKRCRLFSLTLRLVILRRMPFKMWLNQIFLPLIQNTACEAPSGKKTSYQTLFSLQVLS